MTHIQTDFEIRQADLEDLPVILELIKALAEYEHLSGEVVETEEFLEMVVLQAIIILHSKEFFSWIKSESKLFPSASMLKKSGFSNLMSATGLT